VDQITKFWVQVAGALLMAGLAVAQGTRVMQPTYDSPYWITLLAAAALYMVFEAWRTKRKTVTNEKLKKTERKKQ